jgi:hypothetical protein
VVRLPRRDPADDHVRIADRLHLLQAAVFHQAVEHAEDVVEGRDEQARIHGIRYAGKPDDVGEEERDVLVAIGDQRLTGTEPVGDRLGQDVQEQPRVLAMGDLQLADGRHVGAVDVDEPELGDIDGEQVVGATAAHDVNPRASTRAHGLDESLAQLLR